MKIPTNEHEMFERLVQQAHDKYGPHLPVSVRNELEKVARDCVYVFDEDTKDEFDFNS